VKNVANELETDYRFKKGAYADNIRNFLRLYNEISLALKEDTELVNLFQSQLTDTCYPDPELKTLTIDVGFYISRFYSQQDENAEAATEWYGTDYNPGLTIEDWKKLLKDGTIFTTSALEIMRGSKTMVVRPPAHNLRSNMVRQKTSIIPVLLHWLIVSVKPPESSPQQEKMAPHNGGRSFTLGVMQTKARMAALFGN